MKKEKTTMKFGKRAFAAAAAAVIVMAIGLGTAYAYFTTYTSASGTRTIHLGDSTTLEETFSDWKKDITVTNGSDSPQAVFVRVRGFSGEEYPLSYNGKGWSDGKDGYWYYDQAVEPGSAAATITVSIDGVPAAEEGNSFNVVVIYETVPAIQNGEDESGNTVYEEADWDGGEVQTMQDGGAE